MVVLPRVLPYSLSTQSLHTPQTPVMRFADEEQRKGKRKETESKRDKNPLF
jgi:hypothetical protein